MSNARNTKTKTTASATQIVDAKQLSRIMKVNHATVYKLRIAGRLPQPHICNGKMTWSVKRVAKTVKGSR